MFRKINKGGEFEIKRAEDSSEEKKETIKPVKLPEFLQDRGQISQKQALKAALFYVALQLLLETYGNKSCRDEVRGRFGFSAIKPEEYWGKFKANGCTLNQQNLIQVQNIYLGLVKFVFLARKSNESDAGVLSKLNKLISSIDNYVEAQGSSISTKDCNAIFYSGQASVGIPIDSFEELAEQIKNRLGSEEKIKETFDFIDIFYQINQRQKPEDLQGNEAELLLKTNPEYLTKAGFERALKLRTTLMRADSEFDVNLAAPKKAPPPVPSVDTRPRSGSVPSKTTEFKSRQPRKFEKVPSKQTLFQKFDQFEEEGFGVDRDVDEKSSQYGGLPPSGTGMQLEDLREEVKSNYGGLPIYEATQSSVPVKQSIPGYGRRGDAPSKKTAQPYQSMPARSGNTPVSPFTPAPAQKQSFFYNFPQTRQRSDSAPPESPSISRRQPASGETPHYSEIPTSEEKAFTSSARNKSDYGSIQKNTELAVKPSSPYGTIQKNAESQVPSTPAPSKSGYGSIPKNTQPSVPSTPVPTTGGYGRENRGGFRGKVTTPGYGGAPSKFPGYSVVPSDKITKPLISSPSAQDSRGSSMPAKKAVTPGMSLPVRGGIQPPGRGAFGRGTFTTVAPAPKVSMFGPKQSTPPPQSGEQHQNRGRGFQKS